MGSHYTERLAFVLPQPEPTKLLEGLRARLPNVEIIYFKTAGWAQGEPDKEFYKDITILATLTALPPSGDDAPNLRHIHFLGSGTNHVQQHPVFRDPRFQITTSRGVAGPPIAEWVIMNALLHSHQYNRISELQRDREWGKNDSFWGVRDMVGQRIGILGYGGIGRHVGRVAKAMGMDVYAFTATPKTTAEERRDQGFCVPNTGDPEGEIPTKWFSGLDKPSLHEFLKQDLDFVVLSLPLTEKTTKLFSKEEFELLSAKQAMVINVSRGQVIDQPALVQALEEGKLRGAAVDVADPEPLPSSDPLWTAPNVIISPHMSGMFRDYVSRAFDILAINIDKHARGEKMLNLKDKDSDY